MSGCQVGYIENMMALDRLSVRTNVILLLLYWQDRCPMFVMCFATDKERTRENIDLEGR